jgi:hypothetical protein
MAKSGARIAKVRLPPDLAADIDRFSARVQEQSGELNTSSVLRLLLRAGLAADAGRRIDLHDAGFREGWMAGHAQAVEAHQRALHAAQEKLDGRAA